MLTKCIRIIRVALLPVVFSAFAVEAASSYYAAPYLEAIPKVFESVVLCCLFLLLVEFTIPGALSNPQAMSQILGDIRPPQAGKHKDWIQVNPPATRPRSMSDSL
jgi:hypothetical protein